MGGKEVDCTTHDSIWGKSLDGPRPHYSYATISPDQASALAKRKSLYNSAIGPALDPEVRVMNVEALPSLDFTVGHANKTVDQHVVYEVGNLGLGAYSSPDDITTWRSVDGTRKHYHVRIGMAITDDDALRQLALLIGGISQQEQTPVEEVKKQVVPDVRMAPDVGIAFGPASDIVVIDPERGFALHTELPQVEPNGAWDIVKKRFRRGPNFFEYKAAKIHMFDSSDIQYGLQDIIFGLRYISEDFTELHSAIESALGKENAVGAIRHVISPYMRIQDAEE